jgi:hypothetical protein
MSELQVAEALPTAESSPAPARRRWRRWLGALFLLILAWAVGFYAYYRYISDRDLREAIAEADRFEPNGWRMDDIEAQRRVVPDEENAALVVLKVKALTPRNWPPTTIGGSPGDRIATPAVPLDLWARLGELPPEVQIDPATHAELKEELNQDVMKEAVEEANKLSALNEGRFSIVWAPNGVSTQLQTQDARRAATLLQWLALLRAQDGDINGACRELRGLLVTCRAIGDEPTMISQLIRMSVEAIFMQTLERVLAQGQPSADELKRLQELLTAEEAEPLLLYAARGERAGMHNFIEELKHGRTSATAVTGGSGVVTVPVLSVIARRSHGQFLRLMNEYVEAARLPVEEQADPLKAIDHQVREAKVHYNVLIGLLMPAILKSGEAYLRTRAQLRCAVAALALERYRHDHGDWPKKLTDLEGKYLTSVPVDPYDRQPLRYRPTDDGVVVYSVGPDREDNGGASNRHNYLAKHTDLTFRLWDVRHRRQAPAELLAPPSESLGP